MYPWALTIIIIVLILLVYDPLIPNNIFVFFSYENVIKLVDNDVRIIRLRRLMNM